MNYIFLDLEYNQPSNVKATFKFAKYIKNEVIEIGAVKTDEKLNIINSFKCYIKPYLQPNIRPEILKLMGFEDQKYIMTNGVRFKHAMNLFKNFVGNEDFKFIVWGGMNDINILKQNCGTWRVNYNWFKTKKIIDVQQNYMKLVNINQTPSLEKALTNLEIENNPDKLHGALNDCFYTLHVARKIGANNLFEYVAKGKYRMITLNNERSKILKKRLHCPKCGRFIPIGEISKSVVKNKHTILTYRSTTCSNCNIYIFNEVKFIKSKDKKESIIIENLEYCNYDNKEMLQVFYDKLSKINAVDS